MKEIDGVRQIGGLRKEIFDAMGKAEDWESQSIVKGNGKGHSDAVVGVQMKEIDGVRQIGGLKKEILDAMEKAEDWESQSIGNCDLRQ